MLEKFSISITPFQEERMIRVYLPKSYHQVEKRYPVLYMHDGKNVFEDEEAIGGVSLGLKEFVEDRGLDVIVVGIDANLRKDERVNEYCPWVCGEYSEKILGSKSLLGGKGDAYVEFLVHELKPLIDKKYRTDEHQTSMAGISLGALISTYAACRYPSLFTRVGCISSGFYRNQEEIENLIRQSDLSSIERFYLDCGTKEAGDDEEINAEFVAFNQAVYDLISQKVPNSKFQLVDDAGHNYSAFRKRVPEFIAFMYPESGRMIEA